MGIVAMKHRKAQSMLEYAVLFAAVVAALVVMNIYLKRSFQGRYREAADEIGIQYEPGATASSRTLITKSNTTEYQLNKDTSATYTESMTREEKIEGTSLRR